MKFMDLARRGRQAGVLRATTSHELNLSVEISVRLQRRGPAGTRCLEHITRVCFGNRDEDFHDLGIELRAAAFEQAGDCLPVLHPTSSHKPSVIVCFQWCHG
jgi:hypothetical protein